MTLILKILMIGTLTFFLYGVAQGERNSSENSLEYNSDKDGMIAVNDTFYFVSGCGILDFGANVMENDFIPEGITAKVKYAIYSDLQPLSFGQNGNFAYRTQPGFSGLVRFAYHICDVNDESNYAEAFVFIYIKSDYDCDGVFDEQDMDDDNDGIPDNVEGNGHIDTDNDGIPDSFDIDDDNDGIPDIREWQPETTYVLPSGLDSNHNGWDDIYEKKKENKNFTTVDTDKDGIPDFLDSDSDNDDITDLIEATDVDFDSLADICLTNSDRDSDGLDDAFDIVNFYWEKEYNSVGSNVPLPDHNNNGISDYRENIAKEEEPALMEFTAARLTFQNPTSGVFTIQIPDYSPTAETYIKVLNINGELLENIRVTSSVLNMNITMYNPGIYFIKLTSQESFCSKKLILKKD